MNLMADASSREDIWTKTMDFLNMPDWLKLEMVQSVGIKILHVAVWLVISWILLKLFCQFFGFCQYRRTVCFCCIGAQNKTKSRKRLSFIESFFQLFL